MRHEGFRVVFTKAEMHLLLLCSLRHYDGVCRATGNVGGFLYGLKNRIGDDGEVEANLEFRQLDTLAKIVGPVGMASQEQVDLYFELRHALKALNEESSRLNAPQPIIYAIRHKPSGKFMPQRMTATSGRGWSHWQPGSEDGFGPLPRLFKDSRSAKLALYAWLCGRWVRHAGIQDTYDGPEYYDETMPESPTIERRAEDMEVVRMLLIEAKD